MEVEYDDYESYLAHYGTPRHSGRYPWGSGENPYQRNANFRNHVLELRKQGLTNSQIAKGMGMSQKEMMAKMSLAYSENRAADKAMVEKLRDKGYSNSAIGRRMGINESTVRSLLNESIQERKNQATNTADQLERVLKEQGGYLDVGKGVEGYIGVSRYTLDNSLALLKERGYEIHQVKERQLGTGKDTTFKVLAPPGTEWADVAKNKSDIHMPGTQFSDTGNSVLGLQKPIAIDPKRVQVRYAEDVGYDGAKGIDKDGVIELRRGVDDISLGAANYAQVRINIGDTHYAKGMAIYSDNMPPGVDIIFNTNNHRGTPMMGPKDNTVFKPMKVNKETGEIDWDNPFGATIKNETQLNMAQRTYLDKNGKKQLSAINIVNEEGDWEKWSRTLSSQFLSKQSPAMAKSQLKLTSDARQAEYDEIMSLTNPTVKKKLLQEFSDGCDAAAVHLKAAGLPRQASHVILPISSLKDNEIYAPNYKNGEEVALIRYPHAGRFEIPILKVNNKHADAEKVIGRNSPDAVGINSKVAAQLSGADFDGDSVLVIPTKGTDLRADAPFKKLQEFEPKEAYRAYEGMPEVGPETGFHKQRQMGDISNLITDMTIKGAPPKKIERAVRHSMVIIDAEKHNLDWRRSAIDHDISSLKVEYQGRSNAGASTLISKAKSPYMVDDRKEISPDKRTGERRHIYTGRTYVDRDGKVQKAVNKSTKMFEAKDAYELSSGNIMENIYAEHANKLKSLANSARKEAMATTAIPYSPSARKTYSKEVAELEAALNIALKNKPLERQAQLIANEVVRAKKNANPDLKLKENRDELKKVQFQALREARERTGAKRMEHILTDSQWEAIQAGALHKSKLEEVLAISNSDRVKELALPRTNKPISTSLQARIKSMSANGATQAEISDMLGLSTTTINKVLKP